MSLRIRLTLSFLIICIFLSGQKPPNVILILTDDQGWGDLSFVGNSNLKTPNIDQLAKEGIFFDRFFVTPVCSPTRAEILTGRYSPRGGVYSTSAGGERLDLDETTIAEILKENGYRTAAYGKWHNGMQAPYHPNTRGFDDFYGFASGHWGNYFSPMLEHNGEIVKGKGYLPDDLTDHALAFMKKNKRRPFFLYLPYNTPHGPMQVPEEYWQQQVEKPLAMMNRTPEQEDTLFTKAALAMVENIDHNIGRIVSQLKKLKIEEKTIIIFLSDNGPNGVRWNDGMKGRKGSTDEGGVRSPLIVKWKGHIKEGSVNSQIASSVDLFPSIISLTKSNFEAKKKLDGMPLLEGNYTSQDRIIYNYWKGRVSLRTQRFRLDDVGALFDMQEDPGQKTDVRHKHLSEHRRLLEKQAKWMREVAGELPKEDERPFTVGHRDHLYTQLPARDAQFSSGIERSNRWPNCSYLKNWNSTSDSIHWDVSVLEEGDYQVEVYHTCPPTSVASEIRLYTKGGDTVSKIIEVENHPPARGAEHDVYPRKVSLVKDFKPLQMGKIRLRSGPQRLILKADHFKGNEGVEFRLLMLKRIVD